MAFMRLRDHDDCGYGGCVLQRDFYLTANEAKLYGVIDKVTPPTHPHTHRAPACVWDWCSMCVCIVRSCCPSTAVAILRKSQTHMPLPVSSQPAVCVGFIRSECGRSSAGLRVSPSGTRTTARAVGGAGRRRILRGDVTDDGCWERCETMCVCGCLLTKCVTWHLYSMEKLLSWQHAQTTLINQ